MSTSEATPLRKVTTLPLHHTLLRMRHSPLRAFEEIGRESGGDIVRLNLGLFRPYLVTRPDHVEYVLREHPEDYRREGLMWKPLRRLVGDGIVAEGETWASRRAIFHKMFSGRHINSIMDEMAKAIFEGAEDLGRRAGSGTPVDATVEMTRIVQRAVIRVFFGNKITLSQGDVLAEAITTAVTRMAPRLLLPFMPHSVPLPGDRAFTRAVKIVDEIAYPIVRESRLAGSTGDDVVSLLLAARDEHGRSLTDKEVRDDLVAMFLAASETTSVALTWLFVVLDAHPDVARRIYDEIDRVVGTDVPGRQHLNDLSYTKMVLQEMLRLYPTGWLIPRTVAKDDVLDGIAVKKGSTILISPYLTHRRPEVWNRPEVFDPERFGPGTDTKWHRLAYLAFGGGPHACLGTALFFAEAQLIASALFTRFRPVLQKPVDVEPRVALTLRPRHAIKVVLRPVERRQPA